MGERRLIFLTGSAQLFAERLGDLIEAIEIYGFFGEFLFEINYRLVAQRAQPRGHNEKLLRTMAYQRKFTLAEPLAALNDLGIGQSYQTLLHFNPYAKCHGCQSNRVPIICEAGVLKYRQAYLLNLILHIFFNSKAPDFLR